MKNAFFELFEEVNKILYKFHEELNIIQKKKLLKLQIEFLEAAAYNHNAEAQFELALKFAETGYLVPNPFYSKKEYEKWLKIAVDNGNSAAMPNLANVYLWNEDKKKRRIIDGLILLEVARQQNVGYSSHNYTNILKHLKNKKSDLRNNLLIELVKLPDKGKKFLKKYPDYAEALNVAD
ncbi:MAG TPA: hypothetical protein PLQ78_08655 [Flavipsychrobacter sp.]|jgi:TPR repeat protein|nr:hypothetical protein [Flavipsychrobacter sp.]